MSSQNPILNNPFEEPRLHYATNLKGELDYESVMPGRRPFSPEIQTIPVKAGPQIDLPAVVEEAQAAYGTHLVNLLRQEVKVWRDAAYPNTTRVTKELLHYWFLDSTRENHLFFAQREAIETAIWLNEVAEKSNPGQHALAELSRAQAIDRDPANNLPRFAFKMATGTGKTVVMGALIAYHFCNRQEYRSDPRFADNFLLITEGWDANTVTHIVGIRAFNSQLLCEQVAGRALRRKSYQLAPYDPKTGEQLTKETEKRRKREAVREHRTAHILYKFPPEYAHVIGVPFKLFKPGKATPPDPVELTRVRTLEAREARDGIIFPNVEGYRLEYPEGPLTADFTRIDDYLIEANAIPTKTALATAAAAGEVVLSLDDLLSLRESPILFRITKDLIRDHFSDDPAAPAFYRFSELLAIVEQWYATKVRVLGKGPEWKKLLYYADPKKLVAHVARAIVTGPAAASSVRPIFNYYNPTGSTRFVHGNTSKETYATRHSHVNLVVLDSDWEGQAAKVLDDLAAERRIVSWVKNHFLNFRIPYTDKQGESRDYLPDFIVRVNDHAGLPLRLIIEVTGARRDKPEKIWTVTERWLPAINHLPPTSGYGRWDFLEIAGETQVADFRNILLRWLDAPATAKPRVRASVWDLRKELEHLEGPLTEDFCPPPRNTFSKPAITFN